MLNITAPLKGGGAGSGLSDIRLTSKDPVSVTALVYDTSNRPVSVTYLLIDETSETVTLSYSSPDGWLIFNGIEYRNYQYDIFTASIVPLDYEGSDQGKGAIQVQEDEKLCVLNNINKELKKMNMYFTLITNTRL